MALILLKFYVGPIRLQTGLTCSWRLGKLSEHYRALGKPAQKGARIADSAH